jgi:hypothetical protein
MFPDLHYSPSSVGDIGAADIAHRLLRHRSLWEISLKQEGQFRV